jgi:hypothetical protein
LANNQLLLSLKIAHYKSYTSPAVTTTTTTTKTIKTIRTIQTDLAKISPDESSAISKASSSVESLQTLIEEDTPSPLLTSSNLNLDSAYKEYNSIQEFIPKKAGYIILGVNDQLLVYSFLSDGLCYAHNLNTGEKGLCPLEFLKETSLYVFTDTDTSQAKTFSVETNSKQVSRAVASSNESSREVTKKEIVKSKIQKEFLTHPETSNTESSASLHQKKLDFLLESSTVNKSQTLLNSNENSLSIADEQSVELLNLNENSLRLVDLKSKTPVVYKVTRTRMALEPQELNLIAGSFLKVDLILSDGNCYAYVYFQ